MALVITIDWLKLCLYLEKLRDNPYGAPEAGKIGDGIGGFVYADSATLKNIEPLP